MKMYLPEWLDACRDGWGKILDGLSVFLTRKRPSPG